METRWFLQPNRYFIHSGSRATYETTEGGTKNTENSLKETLKAVRLNWLCAINVEFQTQSKKKTTKATQKKLF